VFSNLFFLPIRGVALPILMGLGKASRPTLAFLVAGILNLILSLIWVRPWGLAGVAWGTAIPNIAFAGAILFLVCLELKLPLKRYFGYVAVRATLGAVPVAAFLYWVQRSFTLRSYFSLGVAAFATTFVFGLIWVAFVLRGDPHIDVQSRLNRFWARRVKAAA
jgi:O-antigen/teichoic acid export membrane protein